MLPYTQDVLTYLEKEVALSIPIPRYSLTEMEEQVAMELHGITMKGLPSRDPWFRVIQMDDRIVLINYGLVASPMPKVDKHQRQKSKKGTK